MKLLLINRIKIQNANALSSPYTIGFPAMTAWLGAVHALERHLANTDYEDVHFKSVAVVCHKMDLQTIRGDGDYVHSIIGTGNPLVPKTVKGDPQNAVRPSFIEEARCHLMVSLVVEYEGLGFVNVDEFAETIDGLIASRMKFAGGDVLSAQPTELYTLEDRGERQTFLRRLMPGYCLVERRDLMQQAMAEGKDGLEALLDYLAVHHSSEVDDQGKVVWTSNRKEKGWLVPIATGFHGISESGQAKNQRDPETPHRFAESIVTLGEFIMPYRFDNLDHMLWQYQNDLEKNLYLCTQKQPLNKI
ncbi:MAG: type I-F CRISPR-associated protein Csy2 [Spirochaetales bacterium]|jgi:CRISPR-associated protein Csy2|nr:type I-F CRISPR-associated protein Csy2 [Spirochaetales bacterium]